MIVVVMMMMMAVAATGDLSKKPKKYSIKTMAKMAFWMNSSKRFLLLKIKEDKVCLLQRPLDTKMCGAKSITPTPSRWGGTAQQCPHLTGEGSGVGLK